MSMAEVLVSALILGLSGQVALHGWLRVLALERDGEISRTALQRTDQQLLVARRLLSLSPTPHGPMAGRADSPVAGDCRLPLTDVPELEGLDRLNSAQSAAPQLTASWHTDAAVDGIWLQLSVQAANGGHPSMQRRVLFTAAGLGHCRGALR